MGFKDYVIETKGELKHVSWPTQNQTVNYTLVVVLISILTAGFLSVFDGLFVYALEKFILNS